MQSINTKLELSKVPELVGVVPNKTFKKAYRIIQNTKWPIYLTGPSGGGKSIVAMNIAKKYAEDNNVPAYYIQLSPEQTKTNLILGLRLINGSLKPVNGVVAECMENGGIIIIDEATHSVQELLLMFNSIMDRTSITSIGDKTIISQDSFRVVFCANDSKYSGNVKLPQSFAQRLVAFKIDYPSWEDEVNITKSVAKDECDVEIKVPDEVIRYIVSLMRDVRTESFPLSVRNTAIATVLLQLQPKKKIASVNEDDHYFTTGSNVESIRRNIANRVFGSNVQNTQQLNGQEMATFTRYITRVRISEFKDIILQSFMYYLDIDMGFYDLDAVKQKLQQKII